jgi:transcription initiation factor IIF auxiliary subunit
LQTSFDHLFNGTDQDDPDEFEDNNPDRDLEDMKIEQKDKEDETKREERRDTSQASGYKSASSYTYKASYVSPDREENNLNSYLTN